MSDGIGNRSGWRRQAHLGLAIGTLVAGIVVFASGAAKVGTDALREAGLTAGLAVELAVAGAAVIPLVIVVAVLATADAAPRFQRVTVVGGALAIGGIGVAVTSTTPFENPVAIGLYGVGVVSLLGSLVAGVLDSAASARSDRPTVEYVDRRPTDQVLPSDGGEEDDDLEFLLDDEE